MDVKKSLSGNEKFQPFLSENKHRFDPIGFEEFRDKVEATKKMVMELATQKVKLFVNLEKSTASISETEGYSNALKALDKIVELFGTGNNKEMCFFAYMSIKSDVDFVHRTCYRP
jgi:hypothetical protein